MLIQKIILKITNLVITQRRSVKKFLFMLIDFTLSFMSLIYILKLEINNAGDVLLYNFFSIFLISSIPLIIFKFFDLYNVIFRIFQINSIYLIFKLFVINFCVFFIVNWLLNTKFLILQPILLFTLMISVRLLITMWIQRCNQGFDFENKAKKVIIYGAGVIGRQLLQVIRSDNNTKVIGFVDDDVRLVNSYLDGVRIYNPNEILKLKHKFLITDIFIAINEFKNNEINLKKISFGGINVLKVPNLLNLATGSNKISDLQEININELLNRKPILPNYNLLKKNILNKVVLITGAGGSIGSEISIQTINLNPSKLILLENNELALYKISEILKKNKKNTIIPVLGSVTDNLDLAQIFKAHKIDTIFHCAAFKHVPIVENNPIQGIKNNIFGTYNIINLALKNKVTHFVLISTDKAVRPSSVMGASKRVAEIILQAVANENVYTNFIAVRFGNVLGSSGSVVPKFRKQIRLGGPVNVTHKKVNRYFMTIEEASSLVIQASSLSEKGGGIYLLEMGEPVFIYDLAKRMINLSGCSLKDGNNPNGDIEIKITGLLPGEKIYEELLINSDAEKTLHPKILKANEKFTELKKVKKLLKELNTELNKQDLKNVIKILKELVPEYQVSKKIKVKI